MTLENAVSLQGTEKLRDVGFHTVERDPKLCTELYGDLSRRLSTVQQVQDSHAQRVHPEHGSSAEIHDDGCVGARYSSDNVGKLRHERCFLSEKVLLAAHGSLPLARFESH